jgi:hypothetical protein
MSNLYLKRYSSTPLGTFGKLWLSDDNWIYTIERPWLQNVRNLSCIQAGDYPLKKRHYYRGGYTALQIEGVPQRSYILFHIGNTMHDVEGCIAVGFELGVVNNTWAVLNSRAAFEYLMRQYERHKYARIKIE